MPNINHYLTLPLRDIDAAQRFLARAGSPAEALMLEEYLMDQSDEAMEDAGLSGDVGGQS